LFEPSVNTIYETTHAASSLVGCAKRHDDQVIRKGEDHVKI